jgi:hypothetical protein
LSGIPQEVYCAIASYIALREQDIKHTAAIKICEERLLELKTERNELEKKLEALERQFRSLVNFLAGKGLQYRIRNSDKETLS